ncbi:MAG: thiopurine S-methyltransferase [Myxococcales bacterium]|nr:thiopurine S-methyltransferase [Myxococcales bacterium]
MDPQFWRDRWQEGRIAFHEGRPNALLSRFASRLEGRKRVLVPLCGKSDDLAYLASRGHEVVGIELVEDAVRAFFAEHGLAPEIDGTRYSAAGITLFARDVFDVTSAELGAIDAVYDRAALVALPPELRVKYVAHLRAIAGAVPGLLVAIDYPQELLPGPPFSVPDAEVRTHFASVELLAEDKLQGGRVAELGVAVERIYAVTL